jgi:hypothetical protein
MYGLSAFIAAPGDPSAGIPSASWVVEDLAIDDAEHREIAREALRVAFETIIGDPVRVTFSDEEETT